IPHGGQNPLEPAYWGKPVLCGPHMENFPFIKEFYDSKAAIETSRDGLYDDLNGLLGTASRRDEMGSNAKAILERNRGAVGRAIKVISGLIGD
ncbi:MAG TPA: 3-deoxy-D-manno-octulosonic acid transferase, partial [Nitrospirae bacterium]|nr:3-deoxy-D-manno-octulosonic acid transferase [Nitrospirota bacterium]